MLGSIFLCAFTFHCSAGDTWLSHTLPDHRIPQTRSCPTGFLSGLACSPLLLGYVTATKRKAMLQQSDLDPNTVKIRPRKGGST